MHPIFNFFFESYQNREPYLIVLEAIAFLFGIISVIYAKHEKVLVYPTGLIATTITVYLFYYDKLIGDMIMNFYYSIMSIYGWIIWAKRKDNKPKVPITKATKQEKYIGFFLVILTMLITYFVYRITNTEIKTSNYIDIFTSGLFFTAMWFMATKKIEHWLLWIIADLITIPLYATRGWGMFALQYFIFTILAIQGYKAWKKSLNNNQALA